MFDVKAEMIIKPSALCQDENDDDLITSNGDIIDDEDE